MPPTHYLCCFDVRLLKFLSYKINNFYVTTNYKHEIINSHFKKYKTKINCRLIKENKQLGTAGSLSYLKNSKEDLFFVSNCDSVVSENYNDILKFHTNNKNDITIVASKKSVKFPYGVCLLNDKNKFTGFKEKPNYNFLLNTGLYVINRKELKLLKNNQKIECGNNCTICDSLINDNIHYEGHVIRYLKSQCDIDNLNTGNVLLGDLEKVGWVVLKCDYKITNGGEQ